MKQVSLCLIVLVCATAGVQADEFGIDPTAGNDTIFFRSTARLEFIEGKTNNIVGGFSFDPATPQGKVSGLLRVDLRTLRTGIAMRDEHMRERHLHTDDYPHAYFELTSIEGMPEVLAADSTYNAQARGSFYIHGVMRKITAELTFLKSGKTDGTVLIKSVVKFAIKLDDFKIPRPKALFLKLAETIEVTIVFTAYNSKATSSLSLPDWPEIP